MSKTAKKTANTKRTNETPEKRTW